MKLFTWVILSGAKRQSSIGVPFFYGSRLFHLAPFSDVCIVVEESFRNQALETVDEMYGKTYFENLFLQYIIFSNIWEVFRSEKTFDVYQPFSHRRGDFVWGDALNVMTYHRNKMNEYLCKNYIANEIVRGFQNVSSGEFNKRNGRPQRSTNLARESLLADPGSQKYKDWLDRSSTLEDIYHQFEHGEEDSLGHEEFEIAEHELDHDDMTGYAFLDSKHLYSKPIEYANIHDSESYHFHEHEEEKEDEKGMKLKELFHFALTSIAFLAFATFMIEVIMSLMEIPPNVNSDYVLVPTSTGGTAAGSKNDDAPEGRRRARSLVEDPVSLETLNIMSSKVLTSIESLALLHEDEGECFQRALCQNSKYSTTLTGPQKIWLPIWSFGMSWIGNRLSKDRTAYGNLNAFRYIKASLMGFGSKECHVLYPKCDDRRRRRNRKKSR